MKKVDKSEAAKLRQNEEGTLGNNKEERSSELILANKELAFQITECKQAEEALRESKAKYQAIFECTGTATLIIEEDNTILMANNECYSTTGYTPTELIGQKWSQYVAPESLQEIQKNHQLIRQIPDLAQKKYEVKLINKQGEIRDAILNIGMIPGAKQSIVSISDITERKQAEEKLIIANETILQSEENFRRSISESPLGIRIVSVDGEIIYANKALLDIYGFNSLEEFTSTPIINRYTPESYAQHQERKEKRKNGHDVFDYEISIVCKNTEIRYVKVSRREIMWNGTKHYQVINLDITEQKKLTIDLIAAKKQAEESEIRLLQLNIDKDRFLSILGHDLRSPFNALLGLSEILKENIQEFHIDEIKGMAGDINKTAQSTFNLLEDILTWASTKAGQPDHI